jgi:hypothetical protein
MSSLISKFDLNQDFLGMLLSEAKNYQKSN